MSRFILVSALIWASTHFFCGCHYHCDPSSLSVESVTLANDYDFTLQFPGNAKTIGVTVFYPGPPSPKNVWDISSYEPEQLESPLRLKWGMIPTGMHQHHPFSDVMPAEVPDGKEIGVLLTCFDAPFSNCAKVEYFRKEDGRFVKHASGDAAPPQPPK